MEKRSKRQDSNVTLKKAFTLSELTVQEFTDRYHLPPQMVKQWLLHDYPPKEYLAELLLRVVSLERKVGELPLRRVSPAGKTASMETEHVPLLREKVARQRS